MAGSIENIEVWMTSPDGVVLATEGKYCRANVRVIPELQSKTISATDKEQSIVADSGFVGLSKVVVNPATPVNQVPLATDKNSNIYNGTGYKDNYRIQGSSGNEIACTGSVITGFIPKPNNVVIIKNAEWGYESTGFYTSVTVYDENKNYINTYLTGSDSNTTTIESCGSLVNLNANKKTLTFADNTNIAYYRLSLKGVGSELIINHQ